MYAWNTQGSGALGPLGNYCWGVSRSQVTLDHSRVSDFSFMGCFAGCAEWKAVHSHRALFGKYGVSSARFFSTLATAGHHPKQSCSFLQHGCYHGVQQRKINSLFHDLVIFRAGTSMLMHCWNSKQPLPYWMHATNKAYRSNWCFLHSRGERGSFGQKVTEYGANQTNVRAELIVYLEYRLTLPKNHCWSEKKHIISVFHDFPTWLGQI